MLKQTAVTVPAMPTVDTAMSPVDVTMLNNTASHPLHCGTQKWTHALHAQHPADNTLCQRIPHQPDRDSKNTAMKYTAGGAWSSKATTNTRKKATRRMQATAMMVA